MRVVQKPEYEAFDGLRFPSEKECLAHEADIWPRRFVGLTWEQVSAAVSREDKDLASAFEDIGKKITAKRLEADERKRRSKPKAETPPAPAPATQPEQEPPLGGSAIDPNEDKPHTLADASAPFDE